MTSTMSEELESNFLSSINYVTRSPTYEPERIWNSSSSVPGRSHQWRPGNRNETQKKIVKKYRKIVN